MLLTDLQTGANLTQDRVKPEVRVFALQSIQTWRVVAAYSVLLFHLGLTNEPFPEWMFSSSCPGLLWAKLAAANLRKYS